MCAHMCGHVCIADTQVTRINLLPLETLNPRRDNSFTLVRIIENMMIDTQRDKDDEKERLRKYGTCMNLIAGQQFKRLV